MVGLVILVLLYWFVFRGEDVPPPDDGLLLPQWSDRGGDSNPLAQFCRELEGGSLGSDYDRLPAGVRKLEVGNETLIRDFIQAHLVEVAAFDTLMMTDTTTWQWPGASDMCQIDFKMPYLGSAGSVTQILRLKAHLLCVEGRHEDAAKLALKIIKYGRGLQHSEGAILHMLVAITAEAIGQKALEETLRSSTASPALLRLCLDELRNVETLRRDEFQFTLRTECLWFKHAVESVNAQVAAKLGAPKPYLNGNTQVYVSTLTYKPNRTLAMRYDLDRPVIDAMDHGWNEAFEAAKVSNVKFETMVNSRHSLWFYLDNNLAGKVVNSLGEAAGHMKMMERGILIVTLHNQIEVMLALRLFELEYFKLPESLDDLVPVYLREVPDDHFAGRPMAWKAVEQTVYSVGKDQKDDGGSVNDDQPTKGLDVGMRYWWRRNTSKHNSE